MKSLLLLSCLILTAALAAADRRGNVYISGEEVAIAPFDSTVQYKIYDIDGNIVARDPASASLGKLPCGYYQIEYRNHDNQLRQDSICVLPEPLPVLSENNPVAIDGALFYIFYRAKNGSLKIDYTIDDVVTLIRTANLGYSRERLWWEKFDYLDPSVNDLLVDEIVNSYAKQNIRVLQSLYGTPPAYRYPTQLSASGDRMPPVDLRKLYDYTALLARRWPTQVQAIETWNEPEGIGGGMLSFEIASAQKAANLAAVNGNGNLRSFMGNGSVLFPENLFANDFNGYQNAFCFHHHDKLWSADNVTKKVAAAQNLPVWVTEVSTGSYQLDPQTGELPLSTARIQAQEIPKVYARMLNKGAAKLFYFLLFYHVEESQNTFGLLRQRDLMARPGFVTLANLARALNDYESIRPLPLSEPLEGYRVRTANRSVDIVWSNGAGTKPADLTQYDLARDAFGRDVRLDGQLLITGMPVYLWGPADLSLPAKTVVNPAPLPCPVVLQLILPDQMKNRTADLLMLAAGETAVYPLKIYNFSDRPVTGRIRIDFNGLTAKPITLPEVFIAANSDTEIPLELKFNQPTLSGTPAQMVVRGNFGNAGESVLTANLRVLKSGIGANDITAAIPGWQTPELWKKYIIKDSEMTVSIADGWMVFDYDFRQPANTVVGHVWASPTLVLDQANMPATAPDCVVFEVKLLAGDLPQTIGLNLVETGGATYYSPVAFDAPSLKAGQLCVVPLSAMVNPPFRKKDDNGKLDIDKLSALELPVWAKPHTKIKLAVRNLRWVCAGKKETSPANPVK